MKSRERKDAEGTKSAQRTRSARRSENPHPQNRRARHPVLGAAEDEAGDVVGLAGGADEIVDAFHEVLQSLLGI